MKKYKLQSIISNGTHASNKVKPDLLVGDTSAGYGYGDILDANAVSELIRRAQEEQGVIDIAQSEEIKQKIQEEVANVVAQIISGEIKGKVDAQELVDQTGEPYAIEFATASTNN